MAMVFSFYALDIHWKVSLLKGQCFDKVNILKGFDVESCFDIRNVNSHALIPDTSLLALCKLLFHINFYFILDLAQLKSKGLFTLKYIIFSL